MDNITKMFPDIVQAVEKLSVDSVILDGEIIGYDTESGEYFSFQETMQRKRKYGIKGKVETIPVRGIVFDCLYINGKDITLQPLTKRLATLEKVIPSRSRVLRVSESINAESVKQMQDKFKEYINKGLEGFIAKKKDSLYKPGTRDFDWIKLKASSEEDFVDTVDTVILGYFYGKGARAKFGIGALLAGVYDSKRDKFVSVAKIGTGVKDKEWKLYKKELDEIALDKKPDNVEVEKSLEPDVWVNPEIVSEIEADQITKSKQHTAGKKSGEEQGYSLRFPRMKIFKRDKLPTDATTVAELIEMYKLR
jgi:DNA ligase-1